LDTPVAAAPWVPRLQSFLKLLKSHADRYAALKYLPTATYEDLYFMCEQIENEESWEIDNPVVQPFVEQLRSEVGPLCHPFPPPHESEEITLKILAQESGSFIECVVESMVATSSPPKGLNLISELARESDLELTIASLNHDTLIERNLEREGIHFADGFGKPDGDVSWFDPNEFENHDTKVRLFKLHGSTSWYNLRNRPLQQYRCGKIRNGVDSQHARDAKGELFLPPRAPLCLIGSYNKLSYYQYGIFAHLHTKFFLSLQEQTQMIMSGYGWNDRWMNGRLMEWLHAPGDRRVVLLHERPEELESSKSAMLHPYDDLVKRGKLLLVEKWLCDTSLSDVQPYLQESGNRVA
jgi:hypothetical protein